MEALTLSKKEHFGELGGEKAETEAPGAHRAAARSVQQSGGGTCALRLREEVLSEVRGCPGPQLWQLEACVDGSAAAARFAAAKEEALEHSRRTCAHGPPVVAELLGDAGKGFGYEQQR